MAMSGVTVNDEVVTAFTAMKTKKAHRFLLCSIDGEVKLTHSADPSATFEDFRAMLKDDEPVYAAFDYEWDHEDGGKRSKILFISWIPDTAKVKPKMLYASTKDAVKTALGGGVVEVQATGPDEVTTDYIMSRIGK